MNNYVWLKIIFLVGLGFFFINFASAQTVSLSPSSIQVARNSNFSFVVTVSSVSNLFGVAFDLNFNPSLIDFVSATEGNFLSQGCQTSLMTVENPPGKLIFGLTRLGASCSGVSGSGTLATLNFRSLLQDGSSAPSFSSNSLCILSGSKCNYITGTWTTSSVTVAAAADTTPPTISLTAPSAGSTVSGTAVSISATASDNVGVLGVQFKLDGVNLGSEDMSFPYSITWNTTQTSNGSHTLTAQARDAAGNQTTSSGVSVTVSNATSDTQAPTVTAFTIPSTVSSLTVPITTFTATDAVGVTGYMVNESATAPSASASGWSQTAPTGYMASSAGSKTLYAWAKDAAGNVSTSRSAAVTITLTTDISSGIVGYWKLNETNGTTATDSSGAGNNGTLVNGPTWTAGRTGNALNLDGANDYLSISDSSSMDFSKSQGTIAMWIKPVNPTKGTYQLLAIDSSFSIEFNIQGDGDWFFYPSAKDSWSNYNLVTNPFIVGQWQHAAVIWDFSSKKAIFYLNGQSRSLAIENVPTYWQTLASTADWHIGGSPIKPDNYFNGLIDEVRIYNRALSSSEISQLYNYSGSSDTTPPAAPTGVTVN